MKKYLFVIVCEKVREVITNVSLVHTIYNPVKEISL